MKGVTVFSLEDGEDGLVSDAARLVQFVSKALHATSLRTAQSNPVASSTTPMSLAGQAEAALEGIAAMVPGSNRMPSSGEYTDRGNTKLPDTIGGSRRPLIPLHAPSESGRAPSHLIGEDTESIAAPAAANMGDTTTFSAVRPTTRTKNFSCERVSDYLVQLIRDVVGPMRNPSSASSYDRHILQVDDMLRGGAALGFTPSMVLAGAADMIGICAEAVMKGNLLIEPQNPKLHGTLNSIGGGAGARRHSARKEPSKGPLPAVVSSAGWGGIPMEAFLPPLVQQHTVTAGDAGGSKGAVMKPAVTSSPGSPVSVASERAATFVVRETDETITETAAPQPPLLTLPHALLALLKQCQRPLLCLTLADQRRTPQATLALANALARIVATVRTRAAPPERAVTDEKKSLQADGNATLRSLVTPETVLKCRIALEQCSPTTVPTPVPPNALESNSRAAQTAEGGKCLLGGLSHAAHSAMTQQIRHTALEALHVLLESLHTPPSPPKPLPKKMKAGKPVKDPTRTHRETTPKPSASSVAAAAQGFLQEVQAPDCCLVSTLLYSWDYILRSSTTPPHSCHPDAVVRGDCRQSLSLGEEPRDSVSNVAHHPATPVDAVDGAPRTNTALLFDSARNVRPITAEHRMLVDGECMPELKAAVPRSLRNAPTNPTSEMEEAHARGVVTAVEEAEITWILKVFIDLLSLAEEVNRPIPPTSTLLQAAIPILAMRTLARCAMSDVNATLCTDLLWALLDASPATMAAVLLADEGCYVVVDAETRSAVPADSMPGTERRWEAAAVEPSAMENLFQALLHQLSTSHRKHQRELRNDLVIFLSVILSEDTKRMQALKEASATAAVCAVPPSTFDAVNATVLVLFDLVCGAEVASMAHGVDPVDGSAGEGEDWRQRIRLSWDKAAAAVSKQSRSPHISRESLRRYATLRFQGIAHPAQRADTLQFKRLGWQLLVAFREWQGLNVVGRPLATDSPLDYFNTACVVDLCRMGFVDVLLQYVDTHCDCPIVVAWTREELLMLQVASWELLTALAQSVEDLRRQDVLPTPMDWGTLDLEVEHFIPARRAQQCKPATHLMSDGHCGAEDPSVSSGHHHTADSALSLLYPADVHLVSAGGIACAMRYMEEAPSNVDSLKRAAMLMLSALSRSSHPHVQQALLSTAGLTRFVTLLLKSAQDTIATVSDTALAAERCVSRTVKPNHSSHIDIFLTDSAMELVLSCLDFLKNIGNASVAWALQNQYQQDDLSLPHVIKPTEELGNISAEISGNAATAVTGETLDVEGLGSIQHAFAEAGGMNALVRWMRLAITPQETHAQHLAMKHMLTAVSTAALSANALPSPVAALPTPPLLESFLQRHIPLMHALLHNIRSLVLAYDSIVDDEAEPGLYESFVAADGVHALMDLIEAMCIAANKLPSCATSEPTVIIRNVASVLDFERTRDESGVSGEHRQGFLAILEDALSILSDMLVLSQNAREQFALWSSRRLRRGLMQQGATLRSVMPHEGPSGNMMNSVQLLVALWSTGVSDRASRFLQKHEGSLSSTSSDAASKGFSHHNKTVDSTSSSCFLMMPSEVQEDITHSLRLEYIRRLLRRKYLPATMDCDVSVEMSLGNTSFAPVIDEEILLQCYTFVKFGNDTPREYDSEERSAALQEMSDLLFTTDEAGAICRGTLTANFVQKSMGITVKVFSSLAAFGFEALMRPDEILEKSSQAGATQRSSNRNTAEAAGLTLSPAERAHVTVMAALPALYADELILGMVMAAQLSTQDPVSLGGSVDAPVQLPTTAAADTVEGIHIRPTTPYRRFLTNMKQDIVNRRREIEQLIELSESAEETQQMELLERFLATRIRTQPDDIACLFATAQQELLAKNAAASVCGAGEASPTTRVSKSGKVSAGSLLALDTVPPAALSAGLINRLENEQRQRAAATFAHLGGYPTRWSTSLPVRSCDEEEGGSQPRQSDAWKPETPPPPHTSSNSNSNFLDFVATNGSLSLSAHTLANATRQSSHARSMQERTFLMTAPVARIPALGMPLLPLQSPQSYQWNLAERRRKKMQMIRSSLKKLPQGVSPGHSHWTESAGNLLTATLSGTEGTISDLSTSPRRAQGTVPDPARLEQSVGTPPTHPSSGNSMATQEGSADEPSLLRTLPNDDQGDFSAAAVTNLGVVM